MKCLWCYHHHASLSDFVGSIFPIDSRRLLILWRITSIIRAISRTLRSESVPRNSQWLGIFFCLSIHWIVKLKLIHEQLDLWDAGVLSIMTSHLNKSNFLFIKWSNRENSGCITKATCSLIIFVNLFDIINNFFLTSQCTWICFLNLINWK